MTVLAAHDWPTNAHLIEDVARLGYITDDDLVLDMTYGRGGFWARYRPPRLVTVDINTEAHIRADNRRLPVRDRAFDVAVFDPPYKLNGTPALGDFDARYGIEEVTRWQDRMDRIDDGLIAASRALTIGGRLLVKCQDQVCSGQVRRPSWSSSVRPRRQTPKHHLRSLPRPPRPPSSLEAGTTPRPSSPSLRGRGRGTRVRTTPTSSPKKGRPPGRPHDLDLRTPQQAHDNPSKHPTDQTRTSSTLEVLDGRTSMTQHDQTTTTDDDPVATFADLLAGMVDGILSALDDEGVDLGPLSEPEPRPPITDEWEFVLTFDEAKAIARSILVGDEEATQVKAEINRLVIDCLTEAVETLEDAA